MYFITDKGANDLCIAIATRAAQDYRNAAKMLRSENPRRNVCELKWELRSIERFFLSKYGDIICAGQGEFIINKIRVEFGYEPIVSKRN